MIYTGFDGRLTRNPEQGQTQNGTQYVTFNVATDSSRRDQNGDYLTTFVRVTVWGQRGDFVLNHFMKGDPIFVAGELVLNSYQNQQGEQRQSLELTANNVGFVPQAPKNRAPQQNNQQAPQGQQMLQQNYPQQAPQGRPAPQAGNYTQPQRNGYQGNYGAQQAPTVSDAEMPF